MGTKHVTDLERNRNMHGQVGDSIHAWWSVRTGSIEACKVCQTRAGSSEGKFVCGQFGVYCVPEFINGLVGVSVARRVIVVAVTVNRTQ